MHFLARFVLLCGLVLTGCHTVKRAAVTTFRVIDTPARYVRERIEEPQGTTTTTTTQYGTSDVVHPGRPMEVPPSASAPAVRRSGAPERSVSSPTASPGRVARSEATPQPQPTPRITPRVSSSSSQQFPTARPVPGKPGYVYSIDPSGGIVDVTGYKSGDKAKDPYTQQIFTVP